MEIVHGDVLVRGSARRGGRRAVHSGSVGTVA